MHRPLACRSTIPLVGLVALTLFLVAPPASAETGTVRVTLYSGAEYFEPADGTISLRPRWRSTPEEVQGEKGNFEVEYGTYLLTVEVDGFLNYEREIFVDQPQVDVLVGLRLGEIADFVEPPPATRVVGLLKTDLSSNTLWVRAIPMFGTGTKAFDARPDSRGHFGIKLDAGGDFLLLVLRETPAGEGNFLDLRVVATKQVSAGTYRTERAEITIP